MHDSYRLRSRLLFAGALLAVLSATLVGCDNNRYDERYDDRRSPPQERVNVEDFEVDFDVDSAEFEGAFASAAFDAPELTAEVVDEGIVMAYVEVELNDFGDENTWRALPYTYGVEFEEDPETDEEEAVDYTVTMGYGYKVDFFEVFFQLSDYDDFVWDRLAEEGPYRVRVVAFSRDVAYANPALDLHDYEAVEKRFDLNP